MKIKLVSDLHLEFADITINNDQDAQVLILSGDIMIAEDLYRHPAIAKIANDPALQNLGIRQERAKMFRDFLRRCSESFEHVIYVAGNHEFYDGRWVASLDHLHEECARYYNVYFLEDEIKKIDDVTFIGCTLWTDVNKGNPRAMYHLQSMMTDFHVIRHDDLGYTRLRPAHTIDRHRRSVEYIRTMIEGKWDEKFVVVGHHGPTHLSIHELYKDDEFMNSGYVSDLSEFILDHPQIKLWTHGHTHYPMDYMMGETRVVCNPRGYAGYEPDHGFNPNLILEV